MQLAPPNWQRKARQQQPSKELLALKQQLRVLQRWCYRRPLWPPSLQVAHQQIRHPTALQLQMMLYHHLLARLPLPLRSLKRPFAQQLLQVQPETRPTANPRGQLIKRAQPLLLSLTAHTTTQVELMVCMLRMPALRGTLQEPPGQIQGLQMRAARQV